MFEFDNVQLPSDKQLAAARKMQREVVCRNWLKGTCNRGLACDWLHLNDSVRMPFCKLNRRTAYCHERGIGVCPLKHASSTVIDVGGPTAVPPPMPLPPPTTKLDVCWKYIYGFCPEGPACSLVHIRLDRDKLPSAFLPEWYLRTIVIHGSPIPPIKDEDRRLSNAKWQQVVDSFDTGLRIPAPVGFSTFEDILPAHVLSNPRMGAGTSKIRCFVIKSGKIDNILTSVQRGIWATGKSNMGKLSDAFNTCDYLLLLMSANESGGFQGYARMVSNFDEKLYPGIWGSFSSRLSPNFRVQWLKQAKLDFDSLTSIVNPWNDNKPLKKSRDGQEVPIHIAETVCATLNKLPSEDLLAGTPIANEPRIDHSTFFLLSEQDMINEEINLGLRSPSTRFAESSALKPVLPSWLIRNATNKKVNYHPPPDTVNLQSVVAPQVFYAPYQRPPVPSSSLAHTRAQNGDQYTKPEHFMAPGPLPPYPPPLQHNVASGPVSSLSGRGPMPAPGRSVPQPTPIRNNHRLPPATPYTYNGQP